MPFKDPEKRRAFRRKWYLKNKTSEKKHVKRRKQEIKNWIQEYKSNLKCSECEEDHPATIDFHHKTGEKDQSVSNLVANGYSIERIKKELNKCEVLCANCHRKKHFKNNKL